MYQFRRFGFLGFLLFILVGCGGGPDTTPTFSLAGSAVTVAQGNFNKATIIASFNSGATDTVTLSLESPTPGITGTFEPVTLTASAPQSFLTVNVAASVAPGSYELTIKGTSGGRVGSTKIQLSVQTGGGNGGDLNSGTISGIVIAPGSIDDTATTIDTLAIDTTLHDTLSGDGKASIVPGEVVVQFTSGIRAQAFTSLSVGNTRLERVRSGLASNAQLYRATGLDEAATLQLVRDLEARPDVIDAHPNWIFQAFKAPNDSAYPAQWHYSSMNLPAAWDIEDGVAPEIIVSVVDTGIIAHPDLVARTLPGYDFVSDETAANDGDGRDDDPTDKDEDGVFHGSHVAGTIGATTNNASGVAGVNWGARILPVRVLGIGGGTFVDILDGVAWAAGKTVDGVPANPNKARVINMSLGGTIDAPCPSDANTFFTGLAAEGIIVVVAAGNENFDAEGTFPANCDGVITIGATDILNERAPYSNFGAVIDVMAPGGDTGQSFKVGDKTYPAGVLSTSKNGAEFVYSFLQGTSMASPHVAGLVSLMLAKDSTLSFDAVLSNLKAASTPLSDAQCGRPSAECGAGLVDAAKALGGAGGSPPPPPPGGGNISMYVAAFFCLDAACDDVDNSKSQLLEFTELQDRTPYQVRGLARGSYLVGAWQDLNGNGEPDTGEPLAAFPSLVIVNTGQTASNINLLLEPFSPSATSALTNLLTKNSLEVFKTR